MSPSFKFPELLHEMGDWCGKQVTVLNTHATSLVPLSQLSGPPHSLHIYSHIIIFVLDYLSKLQNTFRNLPVIGVNLVPGGIIYMALLFCSCTSTYLCMHRTLTRKENSAEMLTGNIYVVYLILLFAIAILCCK